VKHAGGARQVFVDVCARRQISHEEVERSILEQSARRWFEELVKLVTTDISAKLPGVIAVCVRDVVLELVGVARLVLRQVHTETNRGSGWTSVETAQTKLDNFHRRNQLRTRIERDRRISAAQERATHFVDPLR